MDPVTLTVVFVILKLTHVIAWSWLWVLAPAWIGAACSAVILFIWAGLVALTSRV